MQTTITARDDNGNYLNISIVPVDGASPHLVIEGVVAGGTVIGLDVELADEDIKALSKSLNLETNNA